MPEEKTLALRMAVACALRECGTRLFEQPQVLLGYVVDLTSPDADTTRALMHNCDDELLSIFSQAAQARTPQAIEDAASRATLLLKKDRMIREDVARRVACEISFALSNHLGVACPEWVRMVAVGKNGTSQRGAAQPQGSTWYDAQRARSTAQNVHQQTATNQSSFGAGLGTNGPTAGTAASQNQGSSSASNTGQNVTTQTRGAASGTTVTLDPALLSTDRTERQKQIENAGIGMHWFELLKWFCWIAAAMRLISAITSLTGLMDVGSKYANWFAYYLVCFVIAGGLCVGYLVSWNNLRLFKASGPKAFLITLGSNAVWPLLACLWLTSMVGKYGLTAQARFDTSIAMLSVIVDAVTWLGTYIYFKKRKQFFNL